MSDDARAEKGGKSGGSGVRHKLRQAPRKKGVCDPHIAGHVLQNVTHLGPMTWAAECGGAEVGQC